MPKIAKSSFVTLASILVVLLVSLTTPVAAQEPFPRADAALRAGLDEAQFANGSQGLDVVGEEIRVKFTSPAIAAGVAKTEALVWSETIEFPGASYIAPHFGHMNLPAGSTLVVRSPDDSRSWSYHGTGRGQMGIEDGFWGIHILGDRAILDLYAMGSVAAGAVVVDSYARGFDLDQPAEKSICGTDNSAWAKCYSSSHPGYYDASRAVARLLINGTSACTGWLVGSQGHLMTANHCIPNQATANNTNYEMMAEGSSCSTNCSCWMSCPGSVVATQATLVQTNSSLDYALVKLPTNPSGTYGYLKMRDGAVGVNWRFYIPQHPGGKGKRLAIYSTHSTDTWGRCQVYSTTLSPPTDCPGAKMGYFCDTQGGSSGAPVIEYDNHSVIALHTCGGCANSGVPIVDIIDDLYLNDNLPYQGVFDPNPPVCPSKCLSGISCTNDCQCGTGTCWQGTCNCEI